MILSTGMSTLDEVKQAFYALTKSGCPEISLLHCTSNYPAAADEVNLLAMKTMQKYFGVTVGYSDHTIGSKVGTYAVAMGGQILEKHFTYDTNAVGPDHTASASPDELRKYVESVRNVELLLGSGIKIPQKSELKTKEVVTKYVVAKHDLSEGTLLDMSMLVCKRGGLGGLLPKHIDEAVGQILVSSVAKDTPIQPGLFQSTFQKHAFQSD